MKWLFNDKKTEESKPKLRTVLPDAEGAKQPTAMLNTVKLMEDSIPLQIKESITLLEYHKNEIERLTKFVAGLKEVNTVLDKHKLSDLSRAHKKP